MSFKLEPSDALASAMEILKRGHDVELRAIDNGKHIIVYELVKSRVKKDSPTEPEQMATV